MSEQNYDQVICPDCNHQFTAVPVNVQGRIAELEQQLVELEGRSAADHIRYQGELETKVVNLTRRIAELEADKERLLLMEEFAVQSFNELTRKYEIVEQQLAEVRAAAQDLLDYRGDTYDESSDCYRIQVLVDGDLFDALAALLEGEAK